MSINKYLRVDQTSIPHGTNTVLIWCDSYKHLADQMHGFMSSVDGGEMSKVNSTIKFMHITWKFFVEPIGVLAYDRNKTVLMDWRTQ